MNQIISQLQNIDTLSFEDAKNATAYVGMAVLPAAAAVFGVDYFKNAKSPEQGVAGAEANTLAEVSQMREGRFKSRLGKWGSVLLLSAGASTLAVNLMEPTEEYPVDIPGAESVSVLDASASMDKTEDMSDGATRLSSIIEISNGTLGDYPADLKAGTIAFGDNVEVVRPLSTNREVLTTEEVEDVVDANGGSLVEALELADTVLAGSGGEGGEALVIYTDGTVENPNGAVEKIEEIAEDGTQVLLALTGTDTGSYTRTEFDIEPIAAGVQTVPLAGVSEFENVEVVESNDPNEIQSAVDDLVNKTTKSTEKRPTDLFWYGGFGLMALGGVNLISRKLRGKR